MKIKKTRLIAAKITEELFEQLEKACKIIPNMYISVYIERAIKNQIKIDLK